MEDSNILQQILDKMNEIQLETNKKFDLIHADIKELKAGQTVLEAGQAETNKRLDGLEAGQAEANKRLKKLEVGQEVIRTEIKALNVEVRDSFDISLKKINTIADATNVKL